MQKNNSSVDILLVEDNPPDAELAIRALKKNNSANHLIWVKDGVEALDFLFCKGKYKDKSPANLPRVILLDLHLPKLNGIEVLKKIKNNKKTRYIPVVILTSSTSEKDIAGGYESGVNSYVSKPVDFESFSKIIQELGEYWLKLNRPPLIENREKKGA